MYSFEFLSKFLSSGIPTTVASTPGIGLILVRISTCTCILLIALLQITLIHRSVHSLIWLAQLQHLGTACALSSSCREMQKYLRDFFNLRYPFQNKIIFAKFISLTHKLTIFEKEST